MNVGAMRALVELGAEQGFDTAKKAMVVLNSLAAIQEGKDAIVEEWRIAALV
ncbi:hypothetical protein AAHE18_04G116700 [Arachis hypogaea]